MTRKGRPPLPPNVLEMRGTARGDRPRDVVVEPLAGDPEPPPWLGGEALAIFWRKVETYQARGQPVRGLEDMIAHYAAAEAELIDCMARRVPVTAAQRNVLLRFATAFYDTAASHVVGAAPPEENRFHRNGRRPADKE